MSDAYLANKVNVLIGTIERLQKAIQDKEISVDEVVSAIDFNTLLRLYDSGLINDTELKNSPRYKEFLLRNNIKRIL